MNSLVLGKKKILLILSIGPTYLSPLLFIYLSIYCRNSLVHGEGEIMLPPPKKAYQRKRRRTGSDEEDDPEDEDFRL